MSNVVYYTLAAIACSLWAFLALSYLDGRYAPHVETVQQETNHYYF
jgi:hypothetical protein